MKEILTTHFATVEAYWHTGQRIMEREQRLFLEGNELEQHNVSTDPKNIEIVACLPRLPAVRRD